jgi:uncharacterized membrane protein YciS (DUF1049 family)
MSAFEIIALIIGIFFIVGIIVGILLVVAIPVLRSVLWERRRHRALKHGNRWKVPPRNDEDTRPPRWPGG